MKIDFELARGLIAVDSVNARGDPCDQMQAQSEGDQAAKGQDKGKSQVEKGHVVLHLSFLETQDTFPKEQSQVF
jgi:hypothetical protein